MKIILATSNKGKIKEIKKFFKDIEIVPYKEIIGSIDIVEDKETFKENALIKAKTIYNEIKDIYPNTIVLSDDSGISIPILGNIPGVYSARFAGENASDKDNLNKLIQTLKSKNIKKTKAYYTAAIAIVSKYGDFTTHGWMWGEVIDEARGEKGFGYDPMFIPFGYDKTLGELDENIKKEISHRSKALKLAKIVIDTIKEKS